MLFRQLPVCACANEARQQQGLSCTGRHDLETFLPADNTPTVTAEMYVTDLNPSPKAVTFNTRCDIPPLCFGQANVGDRKHGGSTVTVPPKKTAACQAVATIAPLQEVQEHTAQLPSKATPHGGLGCMNNQNTRGERLQEATFHIASKEERCWAQLLLCAAAR